MAFVTALVPVILIVVLGRLLAWWKTPPAEGWRAVERISYVLLFPAMIVSVLSKASFESSPWKVAVAVLGAQAAMSLLGLLSRYWPGSPRTAVGCIVQSNARWNTMIALAIVGPLYGADGLALVAIIAASLIPTANVISITALSHFGDGGANGKRHPFAEMARNPIVIACVVGGALNLLKLPPSGVIGHTLDMLGGSAVALGLLAAGAGVDLGALKRSGVRTMFWASFRLLVFPLIAGGIGLALGLERMSLLVVVIAAATPTAATGYILARELGGDAPLMANLIAVQTVLAAVTMPLMFFLFSLLA